MGPYIHTNTYIIYKTRRHFVDVPVITERRWHNVFGGEDPILIVHDRLTLVSKSAYHPQLSNAEYKKHVLLQSAEEVNKRTVMLGMGVIYALFAC